MNFKQLTLCFAGLVFPLIVGAQNYTVDWFKIAGGGGTSTNGQYTLSGTIGQPDAGTMSGGNFSLTGGFWSLVSAVQTPGAPLLSITRSNNVVIVSWPLSATSYHLEQTPALPATSWTIVPPPYSSNATSFYFVVVSPTGQLYFRLHKP